MGESMMGKLRAFLFAVGAVPIHFFLEQALRDKATYDWLVHMMGNEIAMDERSIGDVMPRRWRHMSEFEDYVWLYSSNPLNHGVSRLRFDEAGYLYRLVRSMRDPRIVEIGRYKGGTTLLLAAAGGEVISLDNGQIPGQERFTASLVLTLEQLGLDDRVQVVIADALAYAMPEESCDLVLLDNGVDDFEMAREFFRYWWPMVRPGGYFLFRDGKNTVLRETARFVGTVSGEQIGGSVDDSPPGAFVLCRKSPGTLDASGEREEIRT